MSAREKLEGYSMQPELLIDGEFPHELKRVFEAWESQGNAWGLPAQQRGDGMFDPDHREVQFVAQPADQLRARGRASRIGLGAGQFEHHTLAGRQLRTGAAAGGPEGSPRGGSPRGGSARFGGFAICRIMAFGQKRSARSMWHAQR